MVLKLKSKKINSKNNPSLSIVIPTFNEEYRLPRLLNCLRVQTYQDFEVIVADASSKDNTRKIAIKYGAQVVTGGLPSPGRNAGAKKAKGKWILFLDADVTFEKDFLKKILADAEKKSAGVATVRRAKPESGKIFSVFLYGFYDVYVFCTQKFFPHAPGYCILVKKEVHQKINGFDETIDVLEDADYTRRARKVTSFKILNARIVVSDRRFERGQRWRNVKALLVAEWELLVGKLRGRKHDYTWGEHAEQRTTKRKRA